MPAALADLLLLSHGLLDGRTSARGEAEGGGATSSCPQLLAAVPNFLQGHADREARLVAVARAALLDPTIFQGVCWHLGSRRAQMP